MSKPRFLTVATKDRLPPIGKYVPTVDADGEIMMYRLTEHGWNMRDIEGDATPNTNIKIEYWLEKIKTDRKIVYVDLDGVCANLKKLATEKLKKNPSMLYPQAEYGFFMEMEEIPNAVSVVKTLAEHYEVYFLSAPSYKNPLCLAEKNYWVRNHFGPEWPERLIMSSYKNLSIGDYLIDDNLTGRHQEKFEGEFIHFTEDNNWTKIFEYLMLQLEYDIQHEKKI